MEGKFLTTSKVKIVQNPSCHILEKMNENYDNKQFLAIIKDQRFMGHQSYVLLCCKITSFQPSEGQFSEKSGIF